MNSYRKSLKQRILAIAVAAAMVITLIPATAAFSYAETAYDYQPVIPEGDNMNSMIMLEPSDITVVEETDTYILNRINTPVDGRDKEKGVEFTIAMSAGMNNFSESNFLNNNMPVIKIYNSDGTVAAEYKNGAGDLEFRGSLMTDEINNHGGNKTRELYIGVDYGVLDNGKYVIEFGKNLCGNNTSKILGKDIRFEFTVKATEDLDKVILAAEELLNPENIGDAAGQYPQSAADELQTAVDKANAAMADIDAQLAAGIIDEAAAKEQKDAAALELDNAIRVFKAARIVNISITAINGADSTQYVGDQGTASAAVSADVNDDQYKKVKWEASDNIIIDSVSGQWIAAYAGEGWIRAVSAADSTKTKQIDVNVINEDGIVGVMLADKDVSITDAIANAAGGDISGIESLKLFTAGNYEFAKSDVTAIREAIPELKVLDIKNVALDTIGNSWFAEWNSLEKVVLPDNLTTISIKAFYNCKGLKTVEIPATVDTIGSSAFAGCTALNSTMTVHSANPPSFATAVYENLKFGDSFKGCEDDAAASVKTLKVPYGCAEDYKAADGWKRYNIVEMEEKALTVEYKSAGSLAVACEKALKEKGWDDGEVTTLTITSPSDVALEKTFDIAYLQENFLGATVIDLTGTNFPDNNLQASTFEGRKNVKEIKLPANITNIGRKVFYGCSNMRTLTIPETLRYTNEKSPGIGESALADCDRLTTLVMLPADPPGYMGSMPSTLEEVYVPNLCVDVYKDAFPELKDIIKPIAAVEITGDTDAEVLAGTQLEATVDSAVDLGGSFKWEIVSAVDEENPIATIDKDTGVIRGNYMGTVTVKVTAGYGTMYECSDTCEINIVRPKALDVTAASASYNSIKVSWAPMENAEGYQVYRATSKNGTYSLRTTLGASAASYTNTGLTTGKTYYYKVRGYKTVDGVRVYGDYSEPVSCYAKPADIASVKAVSAGYSSIKVSWTKVTGATGYAIYRATSENGTYSYVTSRSSKYLYYTNTGRTTGKTYYYKVRPYRTVSGKKIYGDYSDVVSAAPVLSKTTTKAARAGYSSIKVSWTGVSGASGYKIYRADSEDGPYTLIKTSSSKYRAYTNTGLTTGKTYYYKVLPYRVVSGKTYYPESFNVASAKPTLSTPTSLTLSRYNSSTVKVKWKGVSGESGYEVYRCATKTGEYEMVGTVAMTSSTYPYGKIAAEKGKTYYYKVRAYKTVGDGIEYSNFTAPKAYKLI